MFFHGDYKPEDRYTFVRNTDLIHNIYKDGNMMLAMGNKYYDGLIFYTDDHYQSFIKLYDADNQTASF